MTDTISATESTDPLADGFFSAAREGRLVIQHCDSCGELRWPPTPGCPNCQSSTWTWEDVGTTGTLWSYAVYHRAFGKIPVPYTVGLVEIADGVLMAGQLKAWDEPWEIGQVVHAQFEPAEDGTAHVTWSAAETPSVEATVPLP